jgi:SAM-dependent methyltransferase
MMREGVERETYFQWLSQAAPHVQLHHLMAGYQISAAIHVAAELKLADLLAAGPQSSAALAQQTQTPAMYRLLRTLASVGLFTEIEPGAFELSTLGVLLRTDHPLSMRALMRYGSGWMQWQRFGALQRVIETGGSVDREVLGMSGREYWHHHPEARAIFDEAMVSNVRQVGDAVVRAYDFSRFQTLVDVGGGYGALLSTILTRTPPLRAVLFDRPEVMPGARAHLESAGVLARCQVVGGDFFHGVPQGGDAYLLSRVIHDWNDERATVLLSQCRRAIQPGGTLLLVEEVLLPGDAPCYGKLSDLNMLVGPGGQERTEAEYRALYTAAGFELVEVMPTESRMSLLVGVPRAAPEA